MNVSRRWRRRKYAEHCALIARFQSDAEAVAGEHGHALAPWRRTAHAHTVAFCTGCTATVALRHDGYGSNGDPTRWLRQSCVPARYFITKSQISPAVHFVHDRENPRGEPIAMKRKVSDANAIIKQLTEPVDEVEVARRKVARLTAQLAKAQAALDAMAVTI